ncbi:MAG: 2-oxo acid dehydrogenase subunit E2 [Clostridiales bacterium]|nr:2-oxo acid dehydrogenase subunit E2 [Clostridiales bacterium]
MFGFRPDGKRVQLADPIVRMTPYIMPQRSDAQVFLNHSIDFEPLARYIADQSHKGNKITFMQIIIAAYVRAVSQHPEVNRFVMNKQLYSRKELTCSFTLLRDMSDQSISENAVKISFDPSDTIYDVQKRVDKAITEGRPEDEVNATLKTASVALSFPFLPNFIVGGIRLLDRYGLLPKAVIDISPFHTSMYLTNMASIGMHSVNHHLYNFGTTGIFLSMGSIERKLVLESNGEVSRKRLLPIGITADERVCAGAIYARLFSTMLHHINRPHLLETPPEEVFYDPGCEYYVPKVEGGNTSSAMHTTEQEENLQLQPEKKQK